MDQVEAVGEGKEQQQAMQLFIKHVEPSQGCRRRKRKKRRKKKCGGPKKHPSFEIMVRGVIVRCQDPKGVRAGSIVSHISCKYRLTKCKIAPVVCRTLQRLVAKGKIYEATRGYYQLRSRAPRGCKKFRKKKKSKCKKRRRRNRRCRKRKRRKC